MKTSTSVCAGKATTTTVAPIRANGRKAHRYPVSEKYHSRLEGRVRDIFANLNIKAGYACETMAIIDRYLAGTPMAEGSVDPTCHIVFLTLKAEIDSAVHRSERARSRAAARSAARKISAGQNSDPSPETITATPVVADTVTPDRSSGRADAHATVADVSTTAPAASEADETTRMRPGRRRFKIRKKIASAHSHPSHPYHRKSARPGTGRSKTPA